MKILQVNNVYGEKSTGMLTKQMHDGLIREGHESLVVYGRGKDTEDAGVIRLCPDWYGKMNSLFSRVTGMPYGGCVMSTARLQRIILREKPDVVHLQCINGNFVNIYRLISWLKARKIKTVVTLHAEFMYTANCGHAFECMQWQHGCQKCPGLKKATRSFLFDRTGVSWKKMKEAFSGFEPDCIITAVSPWTQERAMQSDILKDFRIETVLNSVDTRTVFRAGRDAVRDNVVLNVTAHFSEEQGHNKGGWFLMRLAERMPAVTFLVAGKADPVVHKPDNLHLLGVISEEQELARLYRQAKVSLIVSKRETFSMPCAESLCCGTPVIGFRAGAPEQISLPEYSEFIEYSDLDGLEALVRKWLERKDLSAEQISQAAHRAYSVDTMVRNCLDIYGRLKWN